MVKSDQRISMKPAKSSCASVKFGQSSYTRRETLEGRFCRTFMRQDDFRSEMKPKHSGRPTLIGIPFDGHSSYLRGTAEAPGKIREALACDASNKWTETGVDIGQAEIYADAGDM